MKYIQEQCGHRHINTTEIYLRHLGALDEDMISELDEKQVAM